jgi:HAD superfamily hydrolase (TIGR01509 family)
VPNRFDLLIFDCDGVLVDSERITNTIFAQMLNEIGLAVTLEDMFEQFVGRSMDDCMKRIETMLGRHPSAEFEAEYRARTKAALEQQLVAVPGIAAALDRIVLPTCVASSGDHAKMRLTLGKTGLLPRFEGCLFSVTEVARGKPAPDVFLLAASRMGAAPSRCAVIEDTPTGVAAGIAANMHVFGYAALTPPHRLLEAGAHEVFDDMRELPERLE